MSIETDKQKIDKLAGILEKLQPKPLLSLEELDVWTELAYMLCPDRLNTSSSSNDDIFTTFEGNLKKRWIDRELRASVLLLYSISVQCTVGASSRRGKLESDDPLSDAIDMKAFHFIHNKILQIHRFHENVAAVELIDTFMKHFIIHCPDRLHEIFNVCEEELAHIEELEANHAQVDLTDKYSLNFKVFLNLITRLYEESTPQLILLARQFFVSDFEHLCNFIRSAIAISAPALYVDYILMLEALCKSQISASFLHRLFNSHQEILYDWAGLFNSLRRYIDVFRRPLPGNQSGFQAAVEPPQAMSRQDLLASLSWIRLATKVAKLDPEARRFFVFGNHFNSVDTLVSAVTSSMPVIFKGEVFKFLAVLATDENAATPIWNMLIRDCVCVFGETPGKLVGIQVEFDEIECANRTYDSAQGFLHLVRSLFSKRYLPDAKMVVPYVFFVTKTIICQCDSRSYASVQQLWELIDVGMDSLFQFLRRFHISSVTVSKRTPQVFVLAQLLSDSDLSRALVRILTECANNLESMFAALGRVEFTDEYPVVLARNQAAKSSLRLFSYAINLHASLKASLRTASESTSIFLAPLEAILLTPLSTANQQSYIQMLTAFLDEQEILLPHTYYIIRTLRRLAASSNSEVQNVLLRTFETNASAMRWIFARLMSVIVDELKEKKIADNAPKNKHLRQIEISEQDMIPFDLEGVKVARLRGEIAREILELFIEVMDAASKQPNLTYLMFGFSLEEFQLTKTIGLDISAQELNCMHSLMVLIEKLCDEKDPYNMSYSALFEPALRLLAKFCNVSSLSSEPVLRLMRNQHNLIYKLTQSPIFQTAHDDFVDERTANDTAQYEERVSVHLATFNRQIRGLIFQLVAIDFTVAMNEGHVRTAEDYLTVLLSTNEEQSQAILWSLMYNSISASLEIKTPEYRNFEMSRVDDVLRSCMRSDFSGVQEYDVEMVHFVLNEEISSVANCDINDIKREANEILLYCVQYNAQKRLEGSCLQVLSAWIAFINGVVFFAPLPFVDLGVQEQIFNDALIVLKDYLEAVPINNEVLGGMSNCIFKPLWSMSARLLWVPILNVLIHCLTLPDYIRYTHFKMDIYGSILCLIQACTEQTAEENMKAIDNYTQTGMVAPRQNGDSTGYKGQQLRGGQLYNSLLHSREESLEGLLSRRATVVESWSSNSR
ncbi:hypothetical protein M3Y97_00023300 [Aphelenchoides bicaudatus]|nr:hypothetical protein M3Y97_00023300 [Aphelenchoides bicaudatus]